MQHVQVQTCQFAKCTLNSHNNIQCYSKVIQCVYKDIQRHVYTKTYTLCTTETFSITSGSLKTFLFCCFKNIKVVCLDFGYWSQFSVLFVDFGRRLVVFVYLFKLTLLIYNLHEIKCTHFKYIMSFSKCTHTCETTTQFILPMATCELWSLFLES